MGGKGGKSVRKGLWDRFWVRLPAYLIGTPIILTVVDLILAIVIVLVFGEDDVSQVLSSIGYISLWAAAQMVPLIVPFIAVELGNRRRGWAVPPALCALFISVFSAAFSGTMFGVTLALAQIPQSYRYTSGLPFPVALILGSCVAAGAVSWALVSPLIRRWTIRNASAAHLAEHF